MFTRKITIYSDGIYRQLASKGTWSISTRGKAAHWEFILFKIARFYLILHSYCSHSDWGLMRTRVCFQKISKCYQNNCALQNCILGKEILGRTKSAAWLSSERGRTAGVQLGGVDHCWLTLILHKSMVILKINGPSMNNLDLVEFLQPSYSCVKEYL